MPRILNPEEKYTRKMQELSGVAAGQTATLRMPIGKTYHELMMTYSGVTLAQMTELRLVADGKPIMTIHGADILDVQNQFEGRAAASGVLIVDFERYGLATKANRELTAIGTGHPQDKNPISTLSFEVDIDGAALAPVLSFKARQSGQRVGGLLKHIRKFILTPNAAGEFEWSDLRFIGQLNKISFHGTGINSVSMQADNFMLTERTAAENNLIQADGIRVPQADLFVIDPSERGDGTDQFGVYGASDVRFTLDMAGASTITVLAEFLAPLTA